MQRNAIRKGQPSAGDVHVNRPLTNVSIDWSQNAEGFVHNKVFPVIPVAKQTDSYYIYDKGQWQRGGSQKRAPATESAGSGYAVSTDSYACDVWALHKDVADQDRANSDSPLRPDQDASRWVTEQMMIDKEVEWATKYFSTGVWTVDKTVSPLWDAANSTPIEDVRAEKTAMLKLTGRKPNVMVCSIEVWDVLVDHEDIVARLSGGATPQNVAIPQETQIAAILGLERIYVAEAVQNTANEGASDSNSFVMGQHALLLHVPRVAGLYTPSAGYTFAWAGLLGSSAGNTVISRIRADLLKAWRVEGECAYDQKVVSADLGTLFASVLT